MEKIEAKFIPLVKSSTLPELMAIRGQLRDQVAELKSERLKMRNSLARRARKVKRLAHHRGYKNGLSQMQRQLISKSIEISAKSEEIYLSCQDQALDIIRKLCISVFGGCPAACNELLLLRIKQSIALLRKASLSRIIIGKGSKTRLLASDLNNIQIEESSEIEAGKAIIETLAGIIKIDVIEDLDHAFLTLADKVSGYCVSEQ